MLFKIGVLIYGYFAGALIQAGYWMGKFNKIDIRDYGSGNAGTTNVMRTLGKKAGIATYLLDAFKAVIADILIHFLIVPHTAIPEMLLFLYCGLGIVLGHNFPFCSLNQSYNITAVSDKCKCCKSENNNSAFNKVCSI